MAASERVKRASTERFSKLTLPTEGISLRVVGRGTDTLQEMIAATAGEKNGVPYSDVDTVRGAGGSTRKEGGKLSAEMAQTLATEFFS